MSIENQLLVPSFELLAKSAPEEFENLFARTVSEFFRDLDKLVNTLITTHPTLNLWIGVNGEEKKKQAQDAVIDQNFSKIDDDSVDYERIIHVLSLKNQVRHHIIRNYLRQSATITALDPWEETIIKHYCDIAEVTDEIFMEWRKNLFHSELGKSIRRMEAEKEGDGAKHIKKLGLTNQYCLYEKEKDTWKQLPMARALSQEHKRLSDIFESLIHELRRYDSQNGIKDLIHYFSVLKEAHACVDAEKLDSAWALVDVAWLNVKTRIQPVHAMEYNYMDPARIRVMPEHRILIEDESYGHVNSNCVITQENVITDLRTRYSAKNTWKQSETSMRNSHIGVYVLAIYSGSNLAFKFVGQSAPCRNDIRILHGSKISLNMQSAVDRFENELKYTEAVFGKVTKDKIRSHISPEESISLRIAAHEVAHAAFVNTETDRKIGFGILPLLEEAKATWSGVATIHQRVKRGSIDEGAVDRLLYLMITANMRYITLRGETTLRPYYTEALMGLNTMIECELISKNDNGYFTLDMQKRDIFYEKMNQLYDTIVSIYDEYNGPLAQRLLAEKTKETPKIIEMYELARQVV